MYARKKKLVHPGIQIRLSLLALMGSAAYVIVQAGLFAWFMKGIAAELPEEGALLLEAVPRVLWQSSIVTLAVLTPMVFAVGISATFPILGAVYRFRLFLEAVARGEQVEACKIREKDELQDVCDLINQATESARREASRRGASQETSHLRAA